MRFQSIPFAFVLFCLFAAPAFAGEVTALSNNNLDFALAPDSGTVAGIDAGANTIAFYNSALLLQASEKVGKKPVSVIFKKVDKNGYFVVLSQDKPEITVFDAVTFKKIKTVTLAIPKPYMLVGSLNPKDPYVYYTGNRYHARVHRLNLRTYEMQGPFNNEGCFIAISAWGDYLYCKNRNLSPTGFDCHRIEEDRLVKVHDEHTSRGDYFPDPFNNYCVCGSQVYSVDLKVVKGKLAANVLGFFPDRAAILGLSSNGNLSLMSYNNFNVVQPLMLPRSFMFSKTNSKNARMRCLVDAKRQAVLLCKHNQILTIKYSEFNFPEEPLLIVRIIGSRRVNTGQRTCWKIEPLDKNIKYEISKAPEGVKLEEGQLVWTPGNDQVGLHEIVLRVYSGKAQAFVKHEISVVRPSIVLPFAPSFFSFTDDGRYAVLLNKGKTDSRNPSDDEIALLDVQKGKIVARRTYKKRIRAIFIDEHYVYVAPYDSPMFYALSKTDLSGKKRVFCNNRIVGFDHNQEGCLAAVADRGRDIYYFTLPDLKREMSPISTVPSSRDRNYNRYDMQSPKSGKLQNGYVLRSGAVFDANGNLTMIVKPQHYSSAIPKVNVRVYCPSYLWNRRYYNSQIQTAEGISLGRVQCNSATIIREYPALISAYYTNANNRDRLIFEIRDLVTAMPKEPMVLMDEARNRSNRYGGSNVYLIERNGVAFVFFRQYVFMVQLTPELFSGMEPPLHIEPKVDKQVVSTTTATTVKYRAISGTGEYTFELMSEHETLELNPKTGELKIDGPAILKIVLADMTRIIKNAGIAYETDDMEFLNRRYSGQIKSYEELLGEKAKGVPFTIPVMVNVTDSENQSCTLTHRLYIVVPYDTVLKLVKEHRRKPVEKPKPPIQAPRDPQPQHGDSDNLREEVAQLRQRVAALEAKIDLLLKLLKVQTEEDKTDGDKKEPDNKTQPDDDKQPKEDAKKEDEDWTSPQIK